MSRIYMKVEVQDTVIQKVLLTSAQPQLTMMEDEVTGAILKNDGQKEYDLAPTVALWDLWLYIIWKADRAMVHPLEENWKNLLGIFQKFSFWWRKRPQLR